MAAAAPTSKTLPPAARNKLVIRRLPPTLPEEVFWNSVSTWITDKTCLWKRYVKGASGERNDGYATFSRAYVLMSDAQALIDFHRGYDGHLFRSKNGQEFQAVVEYAPVQKTPYKAKIKVDTRQGTIDDEPDYLSFLESLKAPAQKPPLESTPVIPQPTSTPLLDHLRAHGSKAKKSKPTSTEASSDTAARKAVASISAAAAKRTPQASVGPKMVAGRGREVTITPAVDQEAAPGTSSEAGEGKKTRNRGKKPGNQGDKTPASGEKQASGSAVSNPTRQAERNRPVPASKQQIAPAQDGRNDRANPQKSSNLATVTSGLNGPGDGGRGGTTSKGGRGGSGRGRPRGDGDSKDRSAHNTVISILTRNAEGDRGGRSGRGGRGKGVVEPGAATARIDG